MTLIKKLFLFILIPTSVLFPFSIEIEPYALSSHFNKNVNWNENHNYIGAILEYNNYEIGVNTFINSYYNNTKTISLGYNLKNKYFNVVPNIGLQSGYDAPALFGNIWIEKELKDITVKATVSRLAFILKIGVKIW